MTTQTHKSFIARTISFLKLAIDGPPQDYTKGNISKAVFLLAIPMILEMMMEAVFAIVDIYFVGKLGNGAVATVGLTESVLTIVYSVAIGLSMAATATVARRVGEKDHEAAAKSAIQSVLLALAFTIVVSILGIIFSHKILSLMGADTQVVENGAIYTRIVFGGSIFVMLLFLINGVFRGAGDAAMAMKSLWIANICNIILCPMLINGWGPFPELGLKGAAIATTCGRGIGVVYQLYHLFKGNGVLKIHKEHFIPDFKLIKSLFNIAWTGTLQFLIGSASWIFLARIVSEFGKDVMAGYQVALRIITFFILPAWGLSNAAATLVGQNLGAKQLDRAEKSVWKTALYNGIFMLMVTILFFACGTTIVRFLNADPMAEKVAINAITIVSSGYVFYGVGMVMMNAFNGAGDTKTPTIINLFGFWMFQIPIAYLMSIYWKLGPKGVFMAIPIAESLMSIISVIVFTRGRWKLVKV
jgi:putative MATE family efflux protein